MTLTFMLGVHMVTVPCECPSTSTADAGFWHITYDQQQLNLNL